MGFHRDPSLEDLSVRSATIPRFSENMRVVLVLGDDVQSGARELLARVGLLKRFSGRIQAIALHG